MMREKRLLIRRDSTFALMAQAWLVVTLGVEGEERESLNEEGRKRGLLFEWCPESVWAVESDSVRRGATREEG
jgi:hypothetical protein